MAEAGVPNFDIAGWFVMGVPAATPRDIVARFNQEVVRILSIAEIREKFIASGVEARSSSLEETAAFARDQVQKWGQRFRASGVKLE
jgi:tripartite-type tricarboxylate transporter receptor subunit TctC